MQFVFDLDKAPVAGDSYIFNGEKMVHILVCPESFLVVLRQRDELLHKLKALVQEAEAQHGARAEQVLDNKEN